MLPTGTILRVTAVLLHEQSWATAANCKHQSELAYGQPQLCQEEDSCNVKSLGNTFVVSWSSMATRWGMAPASLAALLFISFLLVRFHSALAACPRTETTWGPSSRSERRDST